VASGSTHLQYNAQQEKKLFFYYTYTIIKIVSIFSTQHFQKKKHVMKWSKSSLQPKVPTV
jgi:hypothetical protein